MKSFIARKAPKGSDEGFESRRQQLVDLTKQIKNISFDLQRFKLSQFKVFDAPLSALEEFYEDKPDMVGRLQETRSALVDAVSTYLNEHAKVQDEVRAFYARLKEVKKLMEKRDDALNKLNDARLAVERTEATGKLGDRDKLKRCQDGYDEVSAVADGAVTEILGVKNNVVTGHYHALVHSQMVMFERMLFGYRPQVMTAVDGSPERVPSTVGSSAVSRSVVAGSVSATLPAAAPSPAPAIGMSSTAARPRSGASASLAAADYAEPRFSPATPQPLGAVAPAAAAVPRPYSPPLDASPQGGPPTGPSTPSLRLSGGSVPLRLSGELEPPQNRSSLVNSNGGLPTPLRNQLRAMTEAASRETMCAGCHRLPSGDDVTRVVLNGKLYCNDCADRLRPAMPQLAGGSVADSASQRPTRSGSVSSESTVRTTAAAGQPPPTPPSPAGSSASQGPPRALPRPPSEKASSPAPGPPVPNRPQSVPAVVLAAQAGGASARQIAGRSMALSPSAGGVPPAASVARSPSASGSADVPGVPRMVVQTIAYLDSHALKCEGLFRESANATQMRALKASYDRNEAVDLDQCKDPHVVAGLLKLHFREKHMPIFPKKSCQPLVGFVEKENDEERIAGLRGVLAAELPPQDYQTVAFLFRFLSRVAENSSINKMSPYNLAICFAPTLFGTSGGNTAVEIVRTLISDGRAVFA